MQSRRTFLACMSTQSETKGLSVSSGDICSSHTHPSEVNVPHDSILMRLYVDAGALKSLQEEALSQGAEMED